jgi:hypothetical protein
MYVWNREQDRNSLLPANYEDDGTDEQRTLKLRRRNRQRLTNVICGLLDDYTFVSFVPLNIIFETKIASINIPLRTTVNETAKEKRIVIVKHYLLFLSTHLDL